MLIGSNMGFQSGGINPGGPFNIVISANTSALYLPTLLIAAGWDGVANVTATITINSGVYVGSASVSTYVFDTGPASVASSARRSVSAAPPASTTATVATTALSTWASSTRS